MFYQYNHMGSPDYMKTEKGSNFNFPDHLHQCFEIIVVLSGQMQVTVDKQSFLLQHGQAVMIFPNQIHSLSSTESKHVLCIFSPTLVSAYNVWMKDKIPENNLFIPDKYLVDALENMEGLTSVLQRKGILYCLCAEFDKNAKYRAKKSDSQKLLYEIFLFVEQNFHGDCSLKGLSQEIGYDYSYLSRYFRKTVGMPFNAFVVRYRLSNACYLMTNTQKPIIDCALSSGFASLRSFNRSFKDNYGITPTQYRNNSRSITE